MLKKLEGLSKEVIKHRRSYPNIFAAYKIVSDNTKNVGNVGNWENDDDLMVQEEGNCMLL